MTQKGEELAARFRAAYEAKKREEAERTAAHDPTRAAAARATLFQDLRAFGEALGFIQVEATPAQVSFRFEDRALTFTAEGEADGVRVAWPGKHDADEHRLYREALLGHRWIWRFRTGGREHRLPLFDQGLELLLVEALGLPAI